MGWRWRRQTLRIGPCLITSVFVITLSHKFGFRDKVPPPREIDYTQTLTWFVRTCLPWWWVWLEWGLARAAAMVDLDSIIVAHALQSSFHAKSHGPHSRTLFLRRDPVKGARVDDLGWWGVHASEASGHLFEVEGSWRDIIMFLHILNGIVWLS